jgi:hypothetical protein
MGFKPAFEKDSRSLASGPAKNGSDHHRYGEVKTRLTIDGCGVIRQKLLSVHRLISGSKYQAEA